MSVPFELNDEEERIREAGGVPRLSDDLKARILMQATRAKKRWGRMRALAVLASVGFVAGGGALLYDRAMNTPANRIADTDADAAKTPVSENDAIDGNADRLRDRRKPIPSRVLP